MPHIFKVDGNLQLASRLREKLNLLREDSWTNYVHQASKFYQVPRDTIESIRQSVQPNRDSRKFFLIQQRNDIRSADLQGNYGYVLGAAINQVDLIIPTSPSLSFEPVRNVKAAVRIYALISRQHASIQEASWDDMDNILNSFYAGQDNEDPEPPDDKESCHLRGDGKFRSYIHAPYAYALKRYTLNSVAAQLKIEQNFRARTHRDNLHPAQKNAKTLLRLSWFARAKENFSWSPLMDGFVGSPKGLIKNAMPSLDSHNTKTALALIIEEELQKAEPDYSRIQTHLTELKDRLHPDARDNIFTELIFGLAGIISAPFAFLIGLIWVIPAYLYGLPYLGQSSFLFDTIQWFVDSLITAVRCLIFPIAMLHAYNTTGSKNVLKSACLRIVETLLARIENISPRLSNDHDPLLGQS